MKLEILFLFVYFYDFFSMKVSRSQKCLEIESIFGFRAEIFSAESASELRVSYDFKAKIDTGL